MKTLILYLFQSSVALGMMYLVYWIFLKRETFFQVNRGYLLFSGWAALLMPFIPSDWLVAAPVSPIALLLDPVIISSKNALKTTGIEIQLADFAVIIYFSVVSMLFLRFLIRIFRMFLLFRSSKINDAGTHKLMLTEKPYKPFSFMNLIFISRATMRSENLHAIIAHEQVHVKQAHSVDRLVIEFLTIIQWFNPFAWLIGHELKNIHEYLADQGVINQGIKIPDYQQMILFETIGIQINPLINNFNVSQLKKRIAMMTTKRSGRWAISKVALVLPAVLVIGLLFSGAKESFSNFQDNKKSSESMQQVEVMPSYAGGHEAMMKFLLENIKYPEQAIKNNTQGTVYVSFTVLTDGKLKDVKIQKGIGNGCDEETVRVVKLMPNWNPGTTKGKPVATQITLPVKFRLDSDKKKEEKK